MRLRGVQLRHTSGENAPVSHLTKSAQKPGCCGENAIPLRGRREGRTCMFWAALYAKPYSNAREWMTHANAILTAYHHPIF